MLRLGCSRQVVARRYCYTGSAGGSWDTQFVAEKNSSLGQAHPVPPTPVASSASPVPVACPVLFASPVPVLPASLANPLSGSYGFAGNFLPSCSSDMDQYPGDSGNCLGAALHAFEAKA
jgi:hypothetical protein